MTMRCHWTQEEDFALQTIITSMAKAHSTWRAAADALGNTKTPRQCRERWRNVLDPSINRGLWTPEEDRLLCEKVRELGQKWAAIANFISGRTGTSVKNRYFSLRRQQQHVERNSRQTELCPQHTILKSLPQPKPPEWASGLQQDLQDEDSQLPMEIRGFCWTTPRPSVEGFTRHTKARM
eukprot:c18939_g1_i3.p1 GENE.c18939_g1_i3~~c18939_g1_i3.p1  ORF type:complete len:180 (-),score=27.87 c18939_g1_i3:425-964(-)